MIVYNVTIKVSWSIVDEWIGWMQEEQIPRVLATGKFDSSKFYKLLDQDETEGPTFVIQYMTSDIGRYERFQQEDAEGLQKEGRDRWGDQFIAFRTVMSLVKA